MSDNSQQIANPIPRYELHPPPIGKGGMGEVYRATDRLTHATVALKRINISNTHKNSDYFVKALAQEFRTLTSLQHPNIVGVDNYGIDQQNQPYFTMEFLHNAKSLSDACEGKTIVEKAQYLIQLLQALTYLHRRQIVHRDLKPDNALVDESDVVKVLDFGLAVEVENVTNIDIAGTIIYIAPEVFIGDPLSSATDLYSVGVIAYELFTGSHPYDVDSTHKLIYSIINDQPDFDLLESKLSMQWKTEQASLSEISSKTSPTKKTSDHFLTIIVNEKELLPDDDTKHYDAPLETEPAEFRLPDTQVSDDPDNVTVDIYDHPTVVGDDVDQYSASTRKAGSVDSDFALKDALTHVDQYDDTTIPPLVRVIRRLLAKNPADRYSNPQHVIEEICQALELDIPAEDQVIRDGFLRAARFVGRKDEYDIFSKALRDAIQGRGSIWLLGGESGVGKSRLINEFTSYGLVEGAQVLRGQAQDTGQESYLLWREPLRQLVVSGHSLSETDASILLEIIPDLNTLLNNDYAPASPLDAKAAQDRLNQTIARILLESQQPLVLILEDLQWALDDLTPLQLLATNIDQYPLLIIGSYRNDESPSLPNNLELAVDQVVTLQRLTKDEMRKLSMSILGEDGTNEALLSFLERETEGNVFFLVEILRALAEETGELDAVLEMDLPSSIQVAGIQAIIEKQLSYVPAEARPTLQLAALAGRFLDLDVLKTASSTDSLDEWLRVCANISVIERQEQKWRFRHDKLREGVIALIADKQKPALHLQIAEAIESTYSEEKEAHAEALAHHYRYAGKQDQEATYTAIAGEQRYLLGNFPTARQYLERTLEVLPVSEASQKLSTLKRLGETYHGLGQYDDAIATFENALKLAKEQMNQEMIAAITNVLGRSYLALRKLDDAKSHFDKALEIARANQDIANQGDAIFYIGAIHVSHDDYDGATSYYQKSLELYEQIDDPRRIGMAKTNLGGMALEQGDVESAQRLFDDALTIATELGNLREMLIIKQNMAFIFEAQGEHDRAHAMNQDSLKLARQMQSQAFIGRCSQILGISHYRRGELDTAKTLLAESIEVQTRISFLRGLSRSYAFLGFTYLKDGDAEQALQTFIDGLTYARNNDDWFDELHLLLGVAYSKYERHDYINGAEVLGYLLAKDKPELEFANFRLSDLNKQFKSKLSSASLEEGLAIGMKRDRDQLLDILL